MEVWVDIAIDINADTDRRRPESGKEGITSAEAEDVLGVLMNY